MENKNNNNKERKISCKKNIYNIFAYLKSNRATTAYLNA